MIRLTTLGRLDLTGSEGQVVRSVLQQPKRLALLVYLALEADDGFVRRDTLLGLFWSEHGEDRARNALNQAVHWLRRSLGRDVIVSRGAEDVGVADDLVWCDAVEFGGLLDAGDRAGALTLYHGEFLRGFYVDDAPAFERWLDRRRTRLRTLAAQAAWTLADDELEGGNRPAAVHWARRAAEFSPYDEPALRRLMRMLDETGDRAGALRAFEGFVRRVASDLGGEPSEETRALAATLRSSAPAETAGADATGEAESRPDRTVADAEDGPATMRIGRAAAGGPTGRGPAADGDAAATGEAAPIATAGATRGAAGEAARSEARRRWPVRRLALAALVASVVLALWALPDRTPPRPTVSVVSGPMRIAVMRFEDYSPERELGYLADALSTTLIERLAEVPTLEIVARHGRTAPVPRTIGLDSAREELDVDLVVSGSVMRSGGQVRASVRLIDARSHTTLETISVERAYGDLFSLLDGVAQELSSALRVSLGREIQLARWRAGTDDVEAWELLQRAQWYRDRANEMEGSGAFGSAEAALLQADSLLARAETLDPGWVEPTVLRGQTAEQLGWLFFLPPLRDAQRFRHYWERGIRHATRALERDPDHTAALELRGSLRHLLWIFAPPDSVEALLAHAERDLRRAVTLDDSRARAWSRLSSILFARGRFSEANLAAERAYTADAYLGNIKEVLSRLAATSLELNDIEAARRWCDEIEKRGAQSYISTHCKLSVLAWGDPPDSLRIGDVWSVVDRARLPAHTRALLRPSLEFLAATTIARMGYADSARTIVDRVSSGPSDTELLRYEAIARTALGQESLAVDLLRRYVDTNRSLYAGVLRSRIFDRLRDRPDFPAINPLEEPGRAAERR